MARVTVVRRWFAKLAPAVVVGIVAALLQPAPAAAEDPVAIESVTPSVAAVGTTITVTGRGFGSVPAENEVRLNGTLLTVVTASAAELTATLPTGVTSGPVTVTAPLGTATSLGDVFVPPTGFAVSDVESTQRLAYDITATAAVTTSGRIALLTVLGTAGHRLSIKLASSTFGSSSNVRISAYRPDGTVMLNPTGFSSGGAFFEPMALTADASYTVLIDPQGTAVGQVAIAAYDVPADQEFTAVTDGSPVTATVTVPGQNATIAFTGTAGQRVLFSLTGGTFGSSSNAKVNVRKPDGTNLTSPTNCGTSCTIDTTTLPVTGTYTIFLDPQGSSIGSLTAKLYDVPADATAGAVIGGDPVTVATSTPGQNAAFTFGGVTGQRVYFRFTGGTYGSSSAATVLVQKPDGTTFVSSQNCGSSCLIDTKVLPADGTYTVFLDPQGTAVGSLTLQLYEVPVDATVATTIGADPITVTTSTPGQNATFTFAGTTGQRVFFAFTGGTYGSSSAATVLVQKPDGTTFVSSQNCGSSCLIDTKVLPVDGTYTVFLDPQGTAVGSLTLQLYDVPDDSVVTATPGGEGVAVTTTTGQNAKVTFDGVAGQQVSIQLSGSTYGSSSSSATASVQKPDGTNLYSGTGLGSSGLLFGPTTLAATGTYTVTINPTGALTGGVSVRVFNVSDATVATTPGGPPVTATTTTPGQNATVTFPATADQRIAVRLTGSTYGSSSSSLNASLLKPDGTVLVAAAGVGSSGLFIDQRLMPVDGTYTVLLDPQGSLTGSVSVEVIDVPTDVSATLPLDGTMVTVATSVPGQNATATFAGTAGQRVGLRFSNGTGSIYATVRKPDGSDLKARWYVGSSDFVEPITLPVDGTYSILVDPNTSALGSMDLQAWIVPADVTGAAAPGGGTVTVTTATPGQNAIVSIDGTAGQRISLRFTTDPAVYLTVKRPDGTDLKARWYAGSVEYVDPLTLPVDGTYTILLDPTSYSVGDMTVEVFDVPADLDLTATADGSATTATFTTPGQNGVVTFSGTAGQRVSMHTDGSVSYYYLTMRNPDDTDLKARWYVGQESFTGPLTLPATGTYSVLIDPNSDYTGAMTLRLWDVPTDATAAATIGGDAVTVANTVPGQNAVVSFDATAGTHVYLTVTAAGLGGKRATVTLYAPGGASMASTNVYATGSLYPLGPAELTTSGTYTILLNPDSIGLGVMTVHLYNATPPPPVAATIGGSAVTAQVSDIGQVASVAFSGTAGQRISVVVDDGTFTTDGDPDDYTARLLSPSGTILDTAYAYLDAELLGPVVLSTSGTYMVTVSPDLLAIGTATVKVYEVPDDQQVTSTIGGEPVALDLTTPGASAVITFPALAGQPLAAQVVNGPEDIDAVFRDPAGNTLCTRTAYLGDMISCGTTSADGTYSIRFTARTTSGTWTAAIIDGIGIPDVTVTTEATVSGWHNTHDIAAEWYAPATVSLAGYAIVVDDQPDTIPAPAVTHTSGDGSFTIPEGVHYLHVRGVASPGFAGPTTHVVIKVDTTAPVLTTLTVPSHPDPAIAYTDLAVIAEFSAEPDVSGVTGYAVSITHGTDDIPLGAPTSEATFEGVIDGEGEWYLHAVAVDGAGNRSTPLHRRILVNVAPGAPRIVSTTHPNPGTAYPGQDFVAIWEPPRSAAAQRWAVAIDHQADTIPDTGTTTVETRFSARLAADVWWLHVRGVDATGIAGATAHFQVVVAPNAVGFAEPLAGRTVWGAVPITLTCVGPLEIQAAADGQTWTTIGTANPAGDGTCGTTWTTSTNWPDGNYTLRALDGPTVVAEGLPVVVDNDLDVIGRLTADYEADVLTVSDYVRYALYAALDPGAVPARYTDGAELPQPEDAIAILNKLWDALPETVRIELANWLTPTVEEAPGGGAAPFKWAPLVASGSSDCGWKVKLKNLTFGCVAESDHFTIYYLEDGVGPTSPGNQRADFIQEMQDALEQAWHVYHDNMGYDIPDHLLVAFDPTMMKRAGLSLPEIPGCGGLCNRPAIIYVDPDWEDTPGDPKVTRYLPRHELFHQVEYEYFNDAYFVNSWVNWWMEASAEWAAHRVEFYTNDSYGGYFGNLGEFLEASDERFDEGNSIAMPGGPEYGAFIVAEYLENRLGPEAVKETWQRMGGLIPPSPGDVVLELLNEKRIEGSIPLELQKFREFAYVLDANGTQIGFSDVDADEWAARFDAPHDTVTLASSGGIDTQNASGEFSIQQSGAHYVEINAAAAVGADITVTYTADDSDVSASLLRLNGQGRPSLACGEPIPLQPGIPDMISLGGLCPRAVLTIVNAEEPGDWGTWSDGTWSVSYVRRSVVLTNGTVDIGVGRYGNIEDPDGVGLRLHDRPDTESVLNGCWCEGWGVGVLGGAGASVTAAIGIKNLTLEDFSIIGNLSTSTMRTSSGLSVIQTTFPSGNTPYLFEMQVIVANTTASPIANVRYRRAVDWDPLPNLYQSYNTVAPLGGDASYITGVTNDGFADPDPALPLTDLGATGWFTDFGPDDTGALIEVNLGTIDPSASKMFSLYYGTAPNEAAAIAAAQAVGAQVYSLGEVDTVEGRDQGLPYTAVLAINGTNVTNPPVGPHGLQYFEQYEPSEPVFESSIRVTRPNQEAPK